MTASLRPVALIGAGGQLASDLAALLPASTRLLSHQEIEITGAESIVQALDDFRDGVVLNTAAYNLVDRAETEYDQAFSINAFGPRLLAKACRDRNLKLVHISTDYVLDADPATSAPLTELALPSPKSVYATSKLTGEYFVQAEVVDHLIIRTCGLYGHAATRAKGNFVETMLRLSESRSELRVVSDQHCTPSFTADVARAIVDLIAADARGIVHVANSGATSWNEFAEEIFRLQNRRVNVVPITTAEYAAPAGRPRYSVLDCRRLERLTGRPMPAWQDALARYLQGRTV